MASITRYGKRGNYRIDFYDTDGSRKSIRLGRVSRRTAENVKVHVEALIEARIDQGRVPAATTAWLESISTQLRDKLVRAGLVEVQCQLTVREYLEEWHQRRQNAGYTPESLIAWGQVIRDLNQCFADRKLVGLTLEDGERFLQYLRSRNLAQCTIAKRLRHAKTMLQDAVKRKLLPANPWQYLTCREGNPASKRQYVSLQDIERVIQAAPDVWWQLLIALARYAGLRIPSEAIGLTWNDVDWQNQRLTVTSPKTARQGKPYRVVPIFPLLLPYLEQAFEAAEPGALYVFPEHFRKRVSGPHRLKGCNLRTTFVKIIRRAGVEPWPKLWHNLRASCESDLAQDYPLAVVTKWLGNTPSIALRHYVDPTDDAFERAKHWVPRVIQASQFIPNENRTGQSSAEGLHGVTQDTHVESGDTPNYRAAKHAAITQRNTQPQRATSSGTKRQFFPQLQINYQDMHQVAISCFSAQSPIMERTGFRSSENRPENQGFAQDAQRNAQRLTQVLALLAQLSDAEREAIRCFLNRE
ncbi:MAG: site-specific integrase [Candidatus Caldarchaeum sp.]